MAIVLKYNWDGRWYIVQSRSSRYQDNTKGLERATRASKNKYLYDDINNKIGVEEYVPLDNDSKIDLSNLSSRAGYNREEYHQFKEYKNIIGGEDEISLDSYTKEDEPLKVYNINDILQEARENRQKSYEEESRKKLKEDNYDILSDLNKKYLTDDSTDDKDPYEGLTELIESITTKVPIEEIKRKEEENSRDLMEELLVTSAINKDDIDNVQLENSTTFDVEAKDKEVDNLINSFYTKSMELSSRDFFDEDDRSMKKGKKILLIVFVIIILIVLILAIVYFVLPSLI